jgi:hypothetical protein
MNDTGKNFWHTTTGMITAVAALITALGGVLGILVQNGIIGGASDGRRTEAASSGDASSPASSEVAPGPSEMPAVIPWDRATATLVRTDGTSTTVKAPTVGLACTTEELAFKNGQRLSLQRVRRIQFDAIFTENSSADGVVTLMDGRALTDPIHTWNCPITGTNELGRVEITIENIKRIDFHR